MQHRRLDYTPSSENLPMVAQVMTEDFIRVGFQDSDCDRIAEAIEDAGVSADRFPTFFKIRGHVKTHKQIMEELEYLKPKALPPTEEQKQQQRFIYNERIKEVLAALMPSKTVVGEIKAKEKHVQSDPEKRSRIKQELEYATTKTDSVPMKTPEQIEAEDNKNG